MLTFDHGLWRDHDDVVGKPPDACGPSTVKNGVLTAISTSEGGTRLPKRTLFRVRFARNGDRLQLTIVSAFDYIAAYVFSGSWQRLG